MDWGNRNHQISGTFPYRCLHPLLIPCRKQKHSDFEWRWYHFDGVDFAANLNETALFRIDSSYGKAWDTGVSLENGNYDYLMGTDVDFDHPEVIEESKRWGEWYVNFADLDGFRLDAVKHIKAGFFNEWLYHVRAATGRELFTVAEYWDYDVKTLIWYLDQHNDGGNNRMHLFDAPLHKNFS